MSVFFFSLTQRNTWINKWGLRDGKGKSCLYLKKPYSQIPGQGLATAVMSNMAAIWLHGLLST